MLSCSRRVSTLLVVLAGAVLTAAGPSTVASADTPPPVQNFVKSDVSVTAGSKLSLHWKTAPGYFFILTSRGSTPLPNFGSSSVVEWPANSGATWSSTYQWWSSRANSVSVAIPANATAGTRYALQLYTCTLSLCSNSPGGQGYSEIEITVARHWRTIPYGNDFRSVTTAPATRGAPFDVTFAGDTIWVNSEFSDSLTRVLNGQSTVTNYPVPAAVQNRPFAECFSNPCRPTSISALGERIIYHDGLVWFTQGGWQFPRDHAAPNHSQIVAYNPSTESFCTYLVPGDDNEVVGIAATGSGSSTRIWFVEMVGGGQPSLDSFSPAQVGTSCPHDYSLAGAPSFRRIPWPRNTLPAMVTPDPDGAHVWVTEIAGNGVSKVNMMTGNATSYTYPSQNAYSYFGAYPWQVAVTTGYVYVINYGDSTLVRIHKASGRIDQVPIPLTSDTEEGYGLARRGNRLYLTLSDDGLTHPNSGLLAFRPSSTVGYVDIGAWEAASAQCAPGVNCAPAPTTAVIYTGLDARVAPSSAASFHGIAAAANGQLAVAELDQVVRLSP
jgi:hypothetical protein